MDIKAHQQALQNIRNKYAQNSITTTKNNTPLQPSPALSNANTDLFKTPTKLVKKEDGSTVNISKPKPQNKPVQQAKPIVPPLVEPSSLGRQGIQAILNKKLAFTKDKGRGRDFDEIITEREKQLTERVQRNRQLLSKSKEVRQRQSKNGSVDKTASPSKNGVKIGKEKKEGEIDLNQLRLILKDKNYNINDKTTHQKKTSINGIGVHAASKEDVYSSIKINFTQKINQNLAENAVNRQPKVPRMNYEKERKKAVEEKGVTSHKNPTRSENRKEKSLIKTPIPPPKQSSPSKIASIFSNTQKIEERIHALLSR